MDLLYLLFVQSTSYECLISHFVGLILISSFLSSCYNKATFFFLNRANYVVLKSALGSFTIIVLFTHRAPQISTLISGSAAEKNLD